MSNVKIIKKQVNIIGNYVFLCGSYFDKSSLRDKRGILQKYIEKNYSSLFPIIIDQAFNPERFIDKSLDIKYMEEIIATIAQSTIVIVESFSSSTELGLFSSSGKNNHIGIVIPKPIDIEHNKVGDFIRSAFKTEINSFEVITYRPAIKRVAINSNIIDEHYFYANDTIPSSIISFLDKISHNATQYTINITSNFDDFVKPIETIDIKYMIIGDSVLVKVSTFLVFHICVSILLNTTENTDKLDLPNIDDLTDEIVDIIKNTIIYQDVELKKNIGFNYVIETEINVNFHTLIKHIANIIKQFYEDENISVKYKKFKNIEIIKKIDKNGLLYSMYDAVRFEKSKHQLPGNKNTESMVIKSGKKKRKITKYSESPDGVVLRAYHDAIAHRIKLNFQYSEYSYAYQEKKGIIDVINKHMYSKFFMLFDVKDFFNSINRDILAQDILRIFKINEYFIEQSIEILDSAFIKNNEQYTIPLGFTISPLLSEVFMKSIDDKISEYCNNNKLIYTRYADDITISSQSRFSEHILIQEINEVLSEKQLILNNDKTRFSNLSKIGHYVKILGVYLTKKSHERKLYVSVGGKYIRNLAKEICGYRNSEISDADYKKKKIQGEIGFLHYVNHDDLIKLTKSVRAMVRDNQYEDLLAEYALYDDE